MRFSDSLAVFGDDYSTRTGGKLPPTVGRDGRVLRTGRLRVVLRKESSVLGYYIKTAYPAP